MRTGRVIPPFSISNGGDSMTKTIFITGGSRGIGEALVRAAAGKYNVAFTYCHNEMRAKEIESELDGKYGGILAIKCDVSSPSDVHTAVEAAKKRFKRVDILINNAGVSASGLLVDMTPEEWRSLMAVNLDGAFFAAREVLPDMLSRGGGAIVNVSSVWGVRGGACEVAYSASKAALIGMTKALAKEVAPMGVTVNAVAPGAIDTDMMKRYSPEEISALTDEHIPLGRLGKPSEVAEAILFLVEQPYVTGQILGVDGGMC